MGETVVGRGICQRGAGGRWSGGFMGGYKRGFSEEEGFSMKD